MKDAVPISIRPATILDRPFVANSWHMSFRGCRQFRGLDYAWYHAAQGLIIDALLDRPETVVLVACDVDEPDVILGWVAGDPIARVMHYIFAKRDLRGGQIGTRLVDALFGWRGGITASVSTAALMRVASSWGVRYAPTMLGASIWPERKREDNEGLGDSRGGAQGASPV